MSKIINIAENYYCTRIEFYMRNNKYIYNRLYILNNFINSEKIILLNRIFYRKELINCYNNHNNQL